MYRNDAVAVGRVSQFMLTVFIPGTGSFACGWAWLSDMV